MKDIGLNSRNRSGADASTELDETKALQRWLRACAEFTAIKLRAGPSRAHRLLLREAEDRVEKAADAYAEALYASIQDPDSDPGISSGPTLAAR